MFEVTDKTITLTRGNSFYTTVQIKNKNGTTYTPQEGDEIVFRMKDFYTEDEPIIEKVIPNDTLLLNLAPEDTEELAFGEYVYSIKITKANGDVDTFIDKGVFIISEEV